MNDIVTKKCGICKEIKSEKEFYKASHHKDKLSSACKKCTDIKNRSWALKNVEKVKNYLKSWRKSNTERDRELHRKWKNEYRQRVHELAKKYTEKHSEKINEYGRKYYNENKEKRIELGRLYRQKNPGKNTEYSRNRRARKEGNGGSITEKEWEDLKNKYDNKCLCCGRSDLKLTLDHVVPLVLGGKHSIENAQPLCVSCNSRKNARHIDYRLK